MSATLRFYSNPMSRGRTARWMLEEVGAPYECHVLDYGSTIKSDEFAKINPMQKVPALKHGDVVVTEAAAICAYLADAFPEAGLAPPTAARGDYYRWLFFGAGPIEAALTNKAFGVSLTDEQKSMAGYGDFERVMDTLEQAVSKADFIAGSTFSAADVYIGSSVDWGLRFKTMDDRPAFRTYRDRVIDRPAYVRANEKDDALMQTG